MGKWIDISLPLIAQLAVWPGDTPFHFSLSSKIDGENIANVGMLTMSTHTGTHIDAPFHVDNKGKQVHELDLDLYIGTAQIIDASQLTSIGAKELAEYNLEQTQRLLIRTNKLDRDLYQFPAQITHLRPDAAPYLAEKGIRLIGVDTPSVDSLDSEDLKTHHALFHHGIHILENIRLDHVHMGICELSAVPLALQNGDGSPVRAVIRYFE